MWKQKRLDGPRLDTLDIFQGCHRHELELIERLVTLTPASPGQVLCNRGGPGQTFFVIVEGLASVSVGSELVARLGPGCGFGEVALLHGGRRIATVTAVTPMTLAVMSRAEFATLIAEIPRVARAILQESQRRLAEATAPDSGRDGPAILTATS
jgi:CRP-like cAMP-binding protein